MGKYQTATPVTLPPPTAGASFLQPLPNMAQGYSPWLLNVDCETQSVKVRGGFVIHCTVGSSSLDVMALGVFGTQASGTYKLLAYCKDGSGTHKVYDVSTATESLEYTAADDTANIVTPFNFFGRLGFTVEQDFVDCGVTYDGSTFTAWGFTDGGSPIGGFFAVAYKSRVYILNSRTLYFGDFEFVTGAVKGSENLASIIDENANLAWGGVISSNTNTADEVYLALGTVGGEILIYGGDYPQSSTWQLVAKFKTDAPLGYGSILTYKNDIWVLTKTGIISVKKLMQSGDQADRDFTTTEQVDSYWTKLINNLSNSYFDGYLPISSAYWPEKNKIYVLIPIHINKDGSVSSSIATMAVYNTLNGAWSFYSLSNISTSRLGGLTYFDNNIYFFTENVVMKFNEAVYKDETYNSAGNYTSYAFEIQGQHLSYGAENANKRMVSCGLICKTDFAGTSVGVRAVADFGNKTSDLSYSELVDGYNVAPYQVGTDGTYLQYRIEGNSDVASTDGFELFAVTTTMINGGRG